VLVPSAVGDSFVLEQQQPSASCTVQYSTLQELQGVQLGTHETQTQTSNFTDIGATVLCDTRYSIPLRAGLAIYRRLLYGMQLTCAAREQYLNTPHGVGWQTYGSCQKHDLSTGQIYAQL
jgi:hypothetical protein